jgi:hypothetical protein
MLAKGVAIGRAFPPMNTMIRVSIGTDSEMAKFRGVLSDLMIPDEKEQSTTALLA